MDHPTAFEPFFLSPLDHLLPSIHMLLFTSFKTDNPEKATSTLQDAVSRLIQKFPFLGGDVVLVSSRDKVNLRQVRPTTTATLNEYPIFRSKFHPQNISYIQNPEIFSNEFSAFPLELGVRERYPLIRFQANIMQDGVILAATFYHPAVDGRGYYNIMNLLSMLCRGENSLPTSALQEAHTRQNIAQIKGTAMESSDAAYGTGDSFGPRSSISRKLFFSIERLKQLKAMCENATSQRITSNSIACALVWLCVVRARAKAQTLAVWQKETTLVTIIDTRQSVFPDVIPSDYLGNGVVFASISYPLPLMLDDIALITDLARRLQQTHQEADTEYAKAIVAQVNASSDWGSFVFRHPEIAISNIRHMNVYGFDFGPDLGFVDRFELHDHRLTGGCWILPARPGETAWELGLALEGEAFKYFEADGLIRWISGRESGDSKL